MAEASQMYASSYEAQARKNNVDIDSRIDPTLRSYMDQGAARFAGETFDGKSRNAVIAGVRNNILIKMDKVNADSATDAGAEKKKHDAYSTQITALIREMRATEGDRAEHERELAKLQQAENNRHGLRKFASFYGPRKKFHASRIASLGEKAEKQKRAIMDKAGKWDDIRGEYRKNTVKKHSSDYDSLGKTWYELTRANRPRGEAGAPAPQGTGTAAPAAPAGAAVRPTVPGAVPDGGSPDADKTATTTTTVVKDAEGTGAATLEEGGAPGGSDTSVPKAADEAEVDMPVSATEQRNEEDSANRQINANTASGEITNVTASAQIADPKTRDTADCNYNICQSCHIVRYRFCCHGSGYRHSGAFCCGGAD